MTNIEKEIERMTKKADRAYSEYEKGKWGAYGEYEFTMRAIKNMEDAKHNIYIANRKK